MLNIVLNAKINFIYIKLVYSLLIIFFNFSYWGLGIGDWGLGNPQSPIPNPQSPNLLYFLYVIIDKNYNYYLIFYKYLIIT